MIFPSQPQSRLHDLKQRLFALEQELSMLGILEQWDNYGHVCERLRKLAWEIEQETKGN